MNPAEVGMLPSPRLKQFQRYKTLTGQCAHPLALLVEPPSVCQRHTLCQRLPHSAPYLRVLYVEQKPVPLQHERSQAKVLVPTGCLCSPVN